MGHNKILTTREKIAHQALILFNQNGIEYVGMRELAASMGMKIGNITYYFRTKDDLVNTLAIKLSELNRQAFSTSERLTMVSFLRMREAVFRNQWNYRCLMLSFVHLVRQNPKIRKRYKEIENERKRGMISTISELETNGYLKQGTIDDMASLSDLIAMISRFWLSNTAITHDEMPVEQQIRHYIGLIASILSRHTTAKGRKEMTEYFEQ
jgi:AcrR family transcriptional regulator